MSIAITDEHRSLAETVADFLRRRDARADARALLEAPDEVMPAFWDDLVRLGWLGLHVPEEHGGSGYGLEELVVVVEEMGRAVTPGPFVPTVIASALLVAAGDESAAKAFLPGLADGSTPAAVALDGTVTVTDGTASGEAVALGGGLARLLVVPAGDDVAVIEVGDGVTIDTPPNLDATRRSSRVTLDAAPATVLAGARRVLTDVARVLLSAEAVGVARECTDLGAAYAKDRQQFGRPIAMFQAVKHHCANMAVATELATERGVGRRSGRRHRWRPALLRRRGGRHAGRAGRRSVRQPQHPGARRHRHHLGARRSPLHASRHLPALPPRRRRRRRGPGRSHPSRCAAGQGGRAAAGGRADPRRGAGVRPEPSRTCPRGNSATG